MRRVLLDVDRLALPGVHVEDGSEAAQSKLAGGRRREGVPGETWVW